MKRSLFTLCFIGCNIVMIFSYIYLKTQIVGAYFSLQRDEKIKDELQRTKNYLSKQLTSVQNLDNIKKYAQTELHMQPMVIRHITTVNLYAH